MSTTAPTPLLDFYVSLGEHDALQEELERDPQGTFESAGFSGDALAELLEGDLVTIRATLQDEIRSTLRAAPRGEGSGEHTPDGEPGEHTPDGEPGEHTPDGEPGEHTPDGEPGEHTPDDDEESGENTPDE